MTSFAIAATNFVMNKKKKKTLKSIRSHLITRGIALKLPTFFIVHSSHYFLLLTTLSKPLSVFK